LSAASFSRTPGHVPGVSFSAIEETRRRKEFAPVVRFIYPDDTFCFRPLHTVQAIFFDDAGVLVARVLKADGSPYVFEIKGFELIEAGRVYP
jgi:hypothetical protein